MSVIIVIPARFGSSRLPGKPLLDILGKPMIQHVVERASAVRSVCKVVVATDDERVAEKVRSFGGEVMMTNPDHASGTDRLVEVMAAIPGDLYVNLQGDEPMARSGDIDKLINGMMADESVQVGTLYHACAIEEARNPNVVKVVLAANGDALYFSRALIPFPRDNDTPGIYFKHVGVYAYRHHVLEQYGRLNPPLLEKMEKLEQLRLLHAGLKIRGFAVEPTGPGVDTPECLERVRALMAGNPDPHQFSFRDVKLVITDVDGVLTDGGIFYDATGECLKRFHARDGLGMEILREQGIQVAMVSGRDSLALRKRAADLEIALFRFDVKDKAAVCREVMKEAGVTPQQTVCIGDDIIDLPAFAVCGFSFAVADAPIYVRQAANRTLTLRGGEGAVREVADILLAARGHSDFLAQ
ncbi:3-deoxy-manno-octulosonate cytidylyltransferase (CMP-KDO synthetase) [Gammaproteobacteria bacterium]